MGPNTSGQDCCIAQTSSGPFQWFWLFPNIHSTSVEWASGKSSVKGWLKCFWHDPTLFRTKEKWKRVKIWSNWNLIWLPIDKLSTNHRHVPTNLLKEKLGRTKKIKQAFRCITFTPPPNPSMDPQVPPPISDSSLVTKDAIFWLHMLQLYNSFYTMPPNTSPPPPGMCQKLMTVTVTKSVTTWLNILMAVDKWCLATICFYLMICFRNFILFLAVHNILSSSSSSSILISKGDDVARWKGTASWMAVEPYPGMAVFVALRTNEGRWCACWCGTLFSCCSFRGHLVSCCLFCTMNPFFHFRVHFTF